MRFSLLFGIAFYALALLITPQSNAQSVSIPGNSVKVYVMKESGDIAELVVYGDAIRYEKENSHSGKPNVLTVLKNVGNQAWLEYEVVAEFHTSKIVGWVQVSNLPPKGDGS